MKQLHKLLVLNIIIVILALMPVEINAANDLEWSKTSELKFNSIAYGNGIYVAVGPNGLVQTTEDGDTWELSEAVVSASLNSVIYTGKEFIAVGDDGAIISSDNGSLWKGLTSGTRTSLRDVAKKGTNYVVVGDKGTILFSKDATKWNSSESGINSSIKGVAANDNLFIAIGCDSKIISSVDGMHWSNSANIINNQTDLIIEDINWSNSSFNAVGYTKDSVFPVVLNSPDGQSWFVEVLYSLSQVDLSNTKLYNITSDGTQNIAVGSQGCVLTLPECHKCRKYKSISKDDLKGIALNSNLIVSVGTMGVYVSPIDATIQSITPEIASGEIASGAYLLDVRSQDEYLEGHIPGSHLIPLDVLENKILESIPDRNKKIIVYCAKGVRSRQACELLVNLGYRNVYNLGGIDKWTYEIEDGQSIRDRASKTMRLILKKFFPSLWWNFEVYKN